MHLRTFLARDMREALVQVRAELGAEAVIVASQKAKGGGVMVRAALEELLRTPKSKKRLLQFAERAPDFETSYHDGLIRRLREQGPSGKAERAQFRSRGTFANPARPSHAGCTGAYAGRSGEKTALTDMTLALASALDKRMKTAPLDIAKSEGLLLAGPQGAGKSAVAAKIAAHARLSGRAVKLVATDTQGAGAIARLETFADHIGVPSTVAENAEELSKAIAECAKDNVLAVIDTAGFDPRNAKARNAFAALAHIEHVEAVGVVSAAGDAEEIADIAASLVSLGARRIIVTGLDLARRPAHWSLPSRKMQRLAHVTRSPFVAGGLETLTPLSLRAR